jgi:hypothetical protein
MRLHKWLVIGGLFAAPVLAEEQQSPSLEMLEYLGSLVETDQGLIGPEDFGETKEQEQQQEKKEEVRDDE